MPVKEHSLDSLMNLAKIATYFESKKTAMGYYSEILKKNKYCMEASFNLIELYATLEETLPSPPSRSASPEEVSIYRWYTDVLKDAYYAFHGNESIKSPIYDTVSSKNLNIVKMRALYELKVGNYDKAEEILRHVSI